jgi:gamma-glutamylcyclotransferase (GGCT)/AIG2-like uncharacterized protein YtfP
MHVFTYGTLMFPEVWRAVVGQPFESVTGHAAGFAIYRVRDALFPGIIASGTTDSVRGVLYLDVDDRSVARLDRFEDDFYRRLTIVVDCDDGRQLEADAYVVPSQHRAVLTDESWSGDGFLSRGDLDRFLAGFAGFSRL